MNYHQDDSRVDFVAFSKQLVQRGNEKIFGRKHGKSRYRTQYKKNLFPEVRTREIVANEDCRLQIVSVQRNVVR